MANESTDQEALKPIYKYSLNPETKQIERSVIKEYTFAWGGKRINFKDKMRVYKNIYVKDMGKFAHGRVYTFDDDIQATMIEAIEDLQERIDTHEANIYRLQDCIRALSDYAQANH